MRTLGRLAYAQARIQARLSKLTSDSGWERLGAVRAYSAYLQEARGTPLRSWVAGISPDSGSHEIERVLRGQFRSVVDESRGWAPEAWRPAVDWVRWLAYVPLLDHLRRGDAAPGWARRDPDLRPWLDASGRLRPQGLEGAGALDLLETGQGEGSVARAWGDGWRRRWPPSRKAWASNLERVAGLFEELLGGADAAQVAGPDGRGHLRGRFERLFRRLPLEPAALFCYLALVALDLERLRGALTARALFAAETTRE